MDVLWPYYGAMVRQAKRLPPPEGRRVRELFAGSASYSVAHDVLEADLYDVSPVVCGVWDYLIKVSAEELLALPNIEEVGDSVDNYDLPQEAKWFIGFWINRGSATPKKSRTAFSSRTERQQLVWGQKAKERSARQLPKIRGWTITQASFEEAPPSKPDDLTFVDCPYVEKGIHYPHSFRGRHAELGEFVRQCPGLVIVCEGPGADWLPFEEMGSFKSTKGRSTELVYIAQDGVQMSIRGEPEPAQRGLWDEAA